MENKGVCNSTKNNIEILQYLLNKFHSYMQAKNADGMAPSQYYKKDHDCMLMTKGNSYGEDDKVKKNK